MLVEESGGGGDVGMNTFINEESPKFVNLFFGGWTNERGSL